MSSFFVHFSGEYLLESTHSSLQLCSGPEAEDLTAALKLLYKLSDVFGYCARDPIIRDCNPREALGCVSDLGAELIEYHRSGYLQPLCSYV